jgi:hypothetical protein
LGVSVDRGVETQPFGSPGLGADAEGAVAERDQRGPVVEDELIDAVRSRVGDEA